jgi:HSP20 family protein
MTNVIVRPRRNGLHRAMLDNFFGGPTYRWADESEFRPRVDVKETENDISLRFEVPGIEKDDIKVVLDNRVLTVSGKREARKEEEGTEYHLTEIRSGSFSRSFTLPETLDAGKINADYKNGMLTITLAKAEEKKPKEVEVRIS